MTKKNRNAPKGKAPQSAEDNIVRKKAEKNFFLKYTEEELIEKSQTNKEI